MRGEQDVLTAAVLQDDDANGVAAKLDVSIDTVRSHIRGIYAKAGATSREELFSKPRPHRL